MANDNAATRLAKIDLAIAEAVAERAEALRDLGAEALQDGAMPIVAGGAGAVPEAALAAVFREVAASSLAAIRPQRVAYLGPEDSFSHLTAIQRFGEASDLVPVATIAAVFDEVATGGCHLGVVPLENSTHGRVTDTLEAFSRTNVLIRGEAPMRIHHNLLGRGARGDVREVHSKPQALAQCGRWLAEHLPGVATHTAASTSEAARLAAENPQIAAIASEQAGRRHGLQVLARNIEDQKDNITRFAVIGREPAAPTGDDKTALMLEIAHKPGSLADAMAVFKREGLNMTWIESFPIPESRGRYLFFIEFHGAQAEPPVARAIATLEAESVRLRVLGCYARSDVLG